MANPDRDLAANRGMMEIVMSEHTPICATPSEDLVRLAEVIENARKEYLDNIFAPDGGEFEARLAGILWNDKGTFAPALRQSAIVDRLTRENEALATVALNLESQIRVEQQDYAKIFAENEAMRKALEEAERFMDYFAEGRTSFEGGGTPKTCLADIRAALASLKEPS